MRTKYLKHLVNILPKVNKRHTAMSLHKYNFLNFIHTSYIIILKMFTYVCKLLYSTTCQLHVPVGTQVSPTAASALICISFFLIIVHLGIPSYL